MALKVMVTGAAGFVGLSVVKQLIQKGHQVVALVNSRPLAIQSDSLRTVAGGLFDPSALAQAMSGCDAVIHLVGIIMEKKSKGITFERIHYEGTRAVVDAAKAAGITRYIQMSALGTRSDAVSNYHRTKYKAEEYVRSSGLNWTIIRPSMIHGPAGEFMKMEAAWARGKAAPFLFMPYFGAGAFGCGGAGKLQPVFVEDVARSFVDALENPKTEKEVYMLGGPDEVTWPQMHRAVAQGVIGKKKMVMALPAWYAKLLTRVVPAFLLPFNADQVVMSQENNTCDISKFIADFGWTPAGFEQSLNGYAKEL